MKTATNSKKTKIHKLQFWKKHTVAVNQIYIEEKNHKNNER